MAQITLENVTVEFTSRALTVKAVDSISLDIRQGEFVALVGPSGCGKSTALNMIAGLLKPSAGSVTYAGAPVAGPNTRVGYMTQKDTLLPWRTVEDNIAIAFELRARKAEAANARERVREMIELVGLAGFERHYPAELSGGMRKRAALARMLIYEPETLLLDEPFGALDAQLRLVMQQELLRLVERRKMTVVLVTHDLEEAVALADRVVVFTSRPGRIRMMRDIDFARPRVPEKLRFTPEFGAICEELWRELREEVAKSVAHHA
ncbi:MAG TPA: ABC transporter ATP-binding protein [Rhizobiaceae bacterium]|nr:ABC transporter ATP-binding protein [Rhizobiaceae bacterium]